MPTCPGCGRRLSHQRLGAHERHCLAEGTAGCSPTERFDRRLSDLERRLDGRLSRLEALVQREVVDPEADDGPRDQRR